MPNVPILGGHIGVQTSVALVDTNALVSFFDPDDTHHLAAKLTLEEDHRYEWLITGPVIVEAAGVLMSRVGRFAVSKMFSWIGTPGKGVSVLTCSEGPNEHRQRWAEHTAFCDYRSIDFVDAYLMRVATLIRPHLGVNSPVVPILTADSDFYKGGGGEYQYGVLDFREVGGEVVELA